MNIKDRIIAYAALITFGTITLVGVVRIIQYLSGSFIPDSSGAGFILGFGTVFFLAAFLITAQVIFKPSKAEGN